MKKKMAKTKKGAAAIYVVIFTTTLLGVITLSFVRIMLSESMRTTNYSLSQSAYNSALAGVEDAKIVLLRYQNCVAFGGFYHSGGAAYNCNAYKDAFDKKVNAHNTAQKCNIIGKFLHGTEDEAAETVVKTGGTDTTATDQAYTCVKISTYTEDFLAVLKEDAPTKIVPLRAENDEEQNKIDRIQISWFNDKNNEAARNNAANLDDWGDTSFSHDGELARIDRKNGSTNWRYSSTYDYGANFGEHKQAPAPLQATYIQTGTTFNVSDFYSVVNGRSNRGTLLMRPSSNGSIASDHGVTSSQHSNKLGAATWSANKIFNTPIDVYCDPEWTNGGGYACAADFRISMPINSDVRNRSTSYLVLNLPYGGPATDVAVKMYSCGDPNKTINNCELIEFAGVQPMVDSTGRANDLFRRVESRIELADTSFPVSSYALAVDPDKDNYGKVEKNFYVTERGCKYSTSTYGNNGSPSILTCGTAGGKNGDGKTP